MPALDGLRGVAVLVVLAYHLGGGSNSPHRIVHYIGEGVKAGWIGVTLFFILSGFLITGILWDTKGDSHWWRNFYLRRTLRILPLYYLSLLLVLITAFYQGTFHLAATRVWSTALFLQNFPGIPKRNMLFPGSTLILRQFWSLAVEEQFYLLWPFLLLIPKSRKGALRLCAATFLLSLAVRLGVWTLCAAPDNFVALLPVRAGEMAAGAWLAIAYRDSLWTRLQPWALRLAAGGILGYCLTSLLNGGAADTGRLQMTVGLASLTIGLSGVLMLCLAEGRIAAFFSMPLLRWLGGISYGVYIYQLLLMPYFEAWTERLTHTTGGNAFLAVRALVTTVLTLVISWVSYHYFESPFLKLKRFFASRPVPGAIPSGQAAPQAAAHIN